MTVVLCQAVGPLACIHPAKYLIGRRDVMGILQWLNVCPAHDSKLGVANLVSGLGIAERTAVALNNRVERVPVADR